LLFNVVAKIDAPDSSITATKFLLGLCFRRSQLTTEAPRIYEELVVEQFYLESTLKAEEPKL